MAPNKKKKNKKKATNERHETDEEMARRLAAEDAADYEAERRRRRQEADLRMAQSLTSGLSGRGEVFAEGQEKVLGGGVEFFGKHRVEDLSIEEMKVVIMQAEMRVDDCVEKSDLVNRCKAAWIMLAMFPGGMRTEVKNNQEQTSAYSRAQSVEFMMHQMRGFQPIELGGICTVDDVVEAARKAASHDDSSLMSNSESSAWNASKPFRVTDKELEAYKAGYLDFLSCYLESETANEIEDDQTTANESPIVALLNESAVSAWVVLGYLEYPFCVFACRKFHHTDKKSAPQLKTMTQFGYFPLGTIVEQIAKWKHVLSWCRTALAENSLPDAVISACFRILASAATGTIKPKKRVRKCVLNIQQSHLDFTYYKQAFLQLGTDISKLLESRPKLPPDILLYALQLPIVTVAAIDASLLGHLQLIPSKFQPAIQRALAEIRDTVEEHFYFELEAHLFARDNPTEINRLQQELGKSPQAANTNDESKSDTRATTDHSHQDPPTSTNQEAHAWNLAANRSTRQCDNPGCTNIASKKCGCKFVSYCSADCQKAHWAQHKHECTFRRSSKKKKSSVVPPEESPEGDSIPAASTM